MTFFCRLSVRGMLDGVYSRSQTVFRVNLAVNLIAGFLPKTTKTRLGSTQTLVV